MLPEEAFVVRVLESIGISAEKIPERTNSRTADLLASDSERRYLIEVKKRTDDETLTREVQETGEAYRTWPLGPTKAVAGILQHAMTQVDATLSDALRLIWVRVESRRAGEYTLAEQVRHTLYGISRVAGTGRGAKAPACYFFHDSVFFRYPKLDGAVITFGNRLVFCVNTYSPRREELKLSALGLAFRRNTLDPVELEREGRCLLADCTIDRKRSDLVLEYVSTKYGIRHAVHFNMDEHAAFAAVNVAGEEDAPENVSDEND
jgi:hypothetical protein